MELPKEWFHMNKLLLFVQKTRSKGWGGCTKDLEKLTCGAAEGGSEIDVPCFLCGNHSSALNKV